MAERKVTYRTYDLNIFWEEFYDKYLGTWWDDKLTIDVYKYETGFQWSDRQSVGLTFKCTREESLEIIEHFPENEYGSDWFVFIEQVMDKFPERVQNILKENLPALEPVEKVMKEEIIMDNVVEVESNCKQNFTVISVMDESFVPAGKDVQIGITTHMRPGKGIVASSSFALTEQEAVLLMDEIEEVLAENKRKKAEREVLRNFYTSTEV